MRKTAGTFSALIFSLVALYSTVSSAAEPVSMVGLKLKVDLGEDLGQNYGSLFQIVDAEGRVLAGAGYQGVYNTNHRGDRRRLHLFIKPTGQADKPTVKPLPRSTTDAGVYLSDFNGRLHAKSASGGRDSILRSWDGKQWRDEDETLAYATYVAGKVLAVNSPRVTYDGRTILDLSDQGVSIGKYYYAAGHLFVRSVGENVNELAACRWRHQQKDAIDYGAAEKIKLRSPQEFIYAYGQLHGEVIVATNTGGVYRFADGKWTCLVEPILNVSYQVYTMINYQDRLLLGQYPTGNLFEYDGQTVQHLPDQPPVMPGVSTRAREAQTTAIYGGDLYVGVWPWAELWRLDGASGEWKLSQRMFNHPAITDQQVHPYETEAESLGHVLNRWGQRITGLAPINDSLFVATSSKGSTPYEEKFQFLNADDKWRDYGRIYELKLPGQASIETTWQEGPLEYEIVITAEKILLRQVGGAACEADMPAGMFDKVAAGALQKQRGVYGKFSGKTLEIDVHKK